MKLISYKEALKMGKDKLKEAMIPVKFNRARKQAELKMCEIEEEIAKNEAAIQDQCTMEDLDFEKIIRLQDDLGLLNRKKEQYQNILDEMFPKS